MQAHVTATLLVQRQPADGPLDPVRVTDLVGLEPTMVRPATRPGRVHAWCHEMPTVVSTWALPPLLALLEELEAGSPAAAAARLAQLRSESYMTLLQLRIEHGLSPDDASSVESLGIGLLIGLDLDAELLARIAALGLHLWIDPELRRADPDEMDDEDLASLEDLANG